MTAESEHDQTALRPVAWQHRLRPEPHHGSGWSEWRDGKAHVPPHLRNSLSVEERPLYDSDTLNAALAASSIAPATGFEVVAWVTPDILAAMQRGERAVPGWKRSDDFCIPIYAPAASSIAPATGFEVKALINGVLDLAKGGDSLTASELSFNSGLVAAANLIRSSISPSVAKESGDDPLFTIRDKTGEEPCGECHLQPGETCDICNATAPEAAS